MITYDEIRAKADEFLYVVYGGNAAWPVRKFNLRTRALTTVTLIPQALLSPGPGFSQGPLMLHIVCSSVQERAYLLVNYWENGWPAKSRVLQIDTGGASILTETTPGESPLWFATKMALSGDSLVSVQGYNDVSPPTQISLQNGARSVLAPIAVRGFAMTAALDLHRLYVIARRFRAMTLCYKSG